MFVGLVDVTLRASSAELLYRYYRGTLHEKLFPFQFGSSLLLCVYDEFVYIIIMWCLHEGLARIWCEWFCWETQHFR